MGCDEGVETSMVESEVVSKEGAGLEVSGEEMVEEPLGILEGNAEVEATRSMVGVRGITTVGLD
jgi:hypothetical protein